jgi:hypothetical protein
MKIINPLYDKAFKYLMENEKFARTKPAWNLKH